MGARLNLYKTYYPKPDRNPKPDSNPDTNAKPDPNLKPNPNSQPHFGIVVRSKSAMYCQTDDAFFNSVLRRFLCRVLSLGVSYKTDYAFVAQTNVAHSAIRQTF